MTWFCIMGHGVHVDVELAQLAILGQFGRLFNEFEALGEVEGVL